MKLTKKFGKYSIELEIADNPVPDESNSDCFISYVTRAGREYTASLACAQDTGELSDKEGRELEIESAIVDEIAEWAKENGY